MKATKLLVAGVAIMSAGFGLSGNANADVSRSTAEVEITPGELILNSVPNMKFEEVTVQQIFDAQPGTPVIADLESGILDIAAQAENNGTSNLIANVEDYRGADTSWDLRVAFAQFNRVGSNGSPTNPAASLTGVTMGLAPTTNRFTMSPIEIPTTDTDVILAAPGLNEGQGEHDLTFDPEADNFLSIPQQNVRAGAYHSVLTWTLADVPGPSTPN